jgi:zinc/manganese transport system permease protein
MSAFHLMLPPFVACMVLLAIHSYLGLHIIAREVIFVDLSLAQMAALGTVVALLLGVSADSRTAYFFGLGFAAVGAGLFALTRTSGKGRVPQEAIIGIVYVVASATAILVASKAPQGAEALEKTLEGNILWVTWPTIERLAIAYAALGAFHFALRKRFLTISFQPEQAEQAGWRIKWWDFLFYLSFGVVITFSVPVGGVLMVFTFLVVPASIAFMFTRDIRKLAYIAWATGAVVSVAGNWISYKADLPTGPLIVCLYGVMLAGAGIFRKLRSAPA